MLLNHVKYTIQYNNSNINSFQFDKHLSNITGTTLIVTAFSPWTRTPVKGWVYCPFKIMILSFNKKRESVKTLWLIYRSKIPTPNTIKIKCKCAFLSSTYLWAKENSKSIFSVRVYQDLKCGWTTLPSPLFDRLLEG